MNWKLKISLLTIIILICACNTKLYEFEREGYEGVYSKKMQQPLYVHYMLTRDCACGVVKRSNNFSEDSLTVIPLLDYYKGSGYDRGHLRPADHSKCSESQMKSTFRTVNLAPQLPSFNRGSWRSLEQYTKNLLTEYDSLEIYSGPIFKGEKKYLVAKEVRIPEAFFKAIKINDTLFLGFILDQNGKSIELVETIVSINEIEKITKIDLFPGTPEQIEKKNFSLYYRETKSYKCD